LQCCSTVGLYIAHTGATTQSRAGLLGVLAFEDLCRAALSRGMQWWKSTGLAAAATRADAVNLQLHGPCMEAAVVIGRSSAGPGTWHFQTLLERGTSAGTGRWVGRTVEASCPAQRPCQYSKALPCCVCLVLLSALCFRA